MDDFEDLLMVIMGVFCVLLCLFLVYLFRFGIGLWGATCAIDSSQPKCVQAGWGEHNEVEIKKGR